MSRTATPFFAAAVLGAMLTASRMAAAAEPEPAQRIRTSAQILGFLGADVALLFFMSPPEADPPGNVRFSDKLTLKAWSFDASAFATNFAAHPLAGTFYYTTARSNRSGPLESIGWATLASLTWELAEFPENVSLNDLIVTPVAGASMGEALVQLSQWLDRPSASPARRVLAAVLFPMKLVNGSPPAENGANGALAARLKLISGVGSSRGPDLGVQLATRLVRLPGFGEPGEGTLLGFGGSATELSLQGRGGRSGLSDLRFNAGAGLARLYQRDFASETEGWDLLLSGGVAFDLRQHAWDDGPLDTWSSVHVPGVRLQIRRIDGPLRLGLRTDVALTYGGARSFALEGGGSAPPIETLPTTQRSWGYTMGWGVAAATSLEAAHGPFSLELGAAIDTRYGIVRPDPWPDRHPSASITDSWSSLRGRFGVKLPWNDLEVSASIERNLRRGSADAHARTAGETVGLFGLGFALE